MHQWGLIGILALSITACIEHRPEDTTFVAEGVKTEIKPARKTKGLRVYAGTTPCADCSAIEQRLALKGDSSGVYRLTETFRQATEDGDAVLVSNGEWKRLVVRAETGKIPIYYLSQGDIRDSSRIIRYQIYPSKITQLDMEGEPIENPGLYTLKQVK